MFDMAKDPLKLTNVAAVVHPKCIVIGIKAYPPVPAAEVIKTALEREKAVPPNNPAEIYLYHLCEA